MPIRDPWVMLAAIFAAVSAVAALFVARRKHGTAAAAVAIAIGNISGFAIALVFFTLPNDLESPNCWWEWHHNIQSLGQRFAWVLLAAPLGMAASLFSLEVYQSIKEDMDRSK
jgi:formate hydrogenlyase subunit 3/multisubunit Na+/H+ antiporter MnhD subunit